jgi:hypothetical protein
MLTIIEEQIETTLIEISQELGLMSNARNPAWLGLLDVALAQPTR